MAVEDVSSEAERFIKGVRRVALAVTVRKANQRVRQQMVGDAVALIVDLAKRLVDWRDSRRRGKSSKVSGSRAEHWQQNSNKDLAHQRRRRTVDPIALYDHTGTHTAYDRRVTTAVEIRVTPGLRGEVRAWEAFVRPLTPYKPVLTPENAFQS